jgi:HEAT repeat protein
VLAASEDDHEQVRLAAHRRLAAMEPWRLWMAINRCSRREELRAVLRQQAPDDRLTALVQERISSPDPHDRVLALELAGHLETPGWVEETVNALQDPEAGVRRAAVDQLRGCDEAVPALVAALHDDPDPGVRMGAASALDTVEVDDALPVFIAALQDPDVGVQRIAVEALVRRSSPGLADRLANGLTVANGDSVGQVLLRMGGIGEEALVAAAVDGPDDRASAAAGLLRKTGKVQGLLRRLRAVDPPARLRAVEALGAVGGPKARDGLVAALSDPWPAIRSRAAFHLGVMGDEAARDPLRRVSECDQALDVSVAAGEALRLIEERPRQAGVRSEDN